MYNGTIQLAKTVLGKAITEDLIPSKEEEQWLSASEGFPGRARSHDQDQGKGLSKRKKTPFLHERTYNPNISSYL